MCSVVYIVILCVLSLFVSFSSLLTFWPSSKVIPKEVKSKFSPNSKFVTVGDGRLLEYKICGAGTMKKPVIANHGFAHTSGMFVTSANCDILRKLGMDIISITQPGFGFSDSISRFVTRNVKDWGKDVNYVLKQENIEGSFYVLGMSAGGSHALSILSHFSDRSIGGAIISSTCPTDVENDIGILSLIPPETVMVKKMLAMHFIGDLLAFVLSNISPLSRYEGAPDCKAALIRLKQEGRNDVVEQFLNDSNLAFTQTFRGWTDNMRTLNGWKSDSIDLSRIKSPIVVTYSEDDTTNPPPMSLWVKNNLKNAELLTFPKGYGHLFSLLPEHFETILKKMIEISER